MLIINSLRSTLTQLHQVLSELSDTDYSRSLQILGNASIGQHTRHVIEFLQTLKSGYETGVINYDSRQRNQQLETDREFANREIMILVENPWQKDKDILLIGSYSPETSEQAEVKSSFYRELVYTLEHAIHHMAIIRIGINHSTKVIVPFDFGIAPATTHYRKQSGA